MPWLRSHEGQGKGEILNGTKPYFLREAKAPSGVFLPLDKKGQNSRTGGGPLGFQVPELVSALSLISRRRGTGSGAYAWSLSAWSWKPAKLLASATQ